MTTSGPARPVDRVVRRRFEAQTWSGETIRLPALESSDLLGVQLRECRWEDARVRDVHFGDCVLTHVVFRNVRFEGCIFHRVQFLDATFENCHFEDCVLGPWTGTRGVAHACTFSKTTLVRWLATEFAILDSTFVEARLIDVACTDASWGSWTIRRSSVERLQLSGVSFRELRSEASRFADARILGGTLEGLDFESSKIERLTCHGARIGRVRIAEGTRASEINAKGSTIASVEIVRGCLVEGLSLQHVASLQLRTSSVAGLDWRGSGTPTCEFSASHSNFFGPILIGLHDCVLQLSNVRLEGPSVVRDCRFTAVVFADIVRTETFDLDHDGNVYPAQSPTLAGTDGP